jgi:hypothetical protein
VPPASPAAKQVIHASMPHWVVIAAVGAVAAYRALAFATVPGVVSKHSDGKNVAAPVLAIDPNALR